MEPEAIISTIFNFIKKEKYRNITNDYNASQQYLKEASKKALDIKYSDLQPQVMCYPNLGIDESKFQYFLGKFKNITDVSSLVRTYGLFCVKLEQDYYIWLPYSNTWYGINLCMKYDEEIMKELCGFHIVNRWSQDVIVLHINETTVAKLIKIIKNYRSKSCFIW